MLAPHIESVAVWYPLVLSVACGALFYYLCSSFFAACVNRRSMPPGPRGLPLLGALFEVPRSLQWLKFHEWKDIHGPIFSFNVAGQNIIVLNSHEVVNDLINRRSADYSHRPSMIVAYELMSGRLAMVLRNYDKSFTRRRRAVGNVFSVRNSEKFQTMQAQDAALSVLDILQSPSEGLPSINKVAAKSIISIVYGIPRTSVNSAYLSREMRTMAHDITSAMATSKYLVDFFPILKHLPPWLAPWKQDALAWHQRSMQLFMGLNREVEVKTAAGDPTPSFVGQLFAEKERSGLDERERAWLGAEMCIAGTDTLAAVFDYFVLGMLLHPHVMRRAHAELDAVVGRDRFPSFKDKDSLPYLQAILKETLRWRPAAPLIVRSLQHDDWYKGYLLPKGSTILINVWSLNHDPHVYANPEDFCPERYLDASGDFAVLASEETHGEGHASFGHGRRTCPGMPLANQMLFIEMAMLLWAFEFQPPIDADGKPILPERYSVVEHGLAISPKPFEINFQPRFAEVTVVIARDIERLGVQEA